MSDSDSLQSHLHKFNKLCNDLLCFDEKIAEDDKAYMLINSLNSVYEPVAKILLYSKDSIEFDDLVAALLSEELMTKDKKEIKNDGDNLYVDTQPGNKGKVIQKGSGSKGKAKYDKGKVVCFYCKKDGHFKKDCNKRKQDREKKEGKRIDQAGVADSGADDGDLLNVSSGADNGEDSWIMDSGCSFHMCPNKEWLHKYHTFDGGSVLMGNNSACKTVGIGSVRIRMFDGVIQTLTDVRHVPELRKNLISLGCLDTDGCRVVMSEGVLKVTKGSLLIVKGKKNRNLYML